MADQILTNEDPAISSNAGLDYDHDTDKIDIETYSGLMTETDALTYQHPDFVEYLPKWEKYTDVYAARDIYQYVHQHSREHPDSYAKRRDRGYYLNYAAGVVDLIVSYLFQAAITRSAGETKNPALLAEFYEDADRRGTKYVSLIQQIATFAQTAGHVGVLVDMPKAEGINTEADRLARRHRPYLTIVQAQQIVDWELDEFGKFAWVKLLMPTTSDRTWRKQADTDTKTYVIWTKDSWEQWEVSGEDSKKVDGGEHSLGVVPLVIVYNERNTLHSWFGESSIRDIADINIAILNWCSLADEETYNRCLNVLAMERQEGGPPVEISHHNVLEYSTGSNPPEFLTPGETPLKMIGEQIDRGRDEIYRLAKMGGSTGLLGVREATSGIAYAFEFNETNQSLARKAECLEQGELEIHRMLYLWLSGQTFNGDWTEIFSGAITYPREFGVEDFLTELRILLESRSTLTSKTAIKEIEKSVCRKFFAKSPQELRTTIEKEVDSAKEVSPVSEGVNIGTMPMTAAMQTPKKPKMPTSDGDGSEND